MEIDVIRDVAFPEWSHVLRDGSEIGQFGRTEECGIIRWVAFDSANRCLGEFGGRGARSRAMAAVVAGE